MEDRFYTFKRVGYFKERIAEILGVEFTGNIYVSQGVINHIKKKHGKHLGKKITSNILDYMKKIIENPDYIGIYKVSAGEVHIEFIKKDEANILIGIGISAKKDYINVATMYPITDAKMESRLYNGKLIKC